MLKANPPSVTRYTRAELLAIVVVYFVQGALGLSRLALSYFLKDDLGLTPGDLSFVTSTMMLPWMIKPIYGFVSDSIPLFGYRRRSYLAVSGLLGAASWGALGLLPLDSAGSVCALLVFSSAGTACADVVIDSIVVERSRNSTALAGSLQSTCWIAASCGGIAAALLSGRLVEAVGPHNVFLLTAFFPLVAMGTSFLIEERPVPSSNHNSASLGSKLRQQGEELWGAVRSPAIFWPAVFIFCWNATPYPEGAMFFFQTERLGLSADFLGNVALVAAVAKLCGVTLYNSVLKDKPLDKVFLWGSLLATLLGLTQLLLVTGANRALGIDDHLFVLGDSALLAAVGEVCWMPVLVYAAQVCPENIEATLFAALMSILNSGGFTGRFLGAKMTDALGVTSEDFSNLPLLVLICVALTPLPLVFLPTVRKSLEGQAKRDDESADADHEA
jgi:folate/biopterin transporter